MMKPITASCPKPDAESLKKFYGVDLEAEISWTLRNELRNLADADGLAITDEHIQAEVVSQMAEQHKNGKQNYEITIASETAELLSRYDGLPRTLLIVMIEHMAARES